MEFKLPEKSGPRIRNGALGPSNQIFVAKDTRKHAPWGIKKKHRAALLAYLSNPDNEWPKRNKYVSLLGMKSNSGYIYNIFSADELSKLEAEALEKKRTQYAIRTARIDDAFFEKAKEGGAAEVKLWYKRFDGWEEKSVTENTTTIIHKLDDQLAKMLKPAHYGEVTVHDDDTEPKIGILPADV